VNRSWPKSVKLDGTDVCLAAKNRRGNSSCGLQVVDVKSVVDLVVAVSAGNLETIHVLCTCLRLPIQQDATKVSAHCEHVS
jgi:hypothetical protein